ncbi:hypothetical protein SAMN05216464_101114 [Mucilaginibacter pineti]|uniref:Uncharacterized protein n=1 Tax=Mucilaginibacter pineti TaxID=1391627 RepID=A0A1G6T149_9SPHI|nr:hypothetical protein SAMN05216464_101114 [Mucilaginibacter pineti]
MRADDLLTATDEVLTAADDILTVADESNLFRKIFS